MPRRPGPPSPAQYNPAPPPRVHLARELPRAELAAHLRDGRWEKIRHGAYVEKIEIPDAYEQQRQRALAHVAAVGRQNVRERVFSHVSAALLHGLPVMGPVSQVHLAQTSPGGARDASDVRRHFVELPDSQVTSRHGLLVTSLERTLVDCATALPRRQGLVIADAALHVGADHDECSRILEGVRSARGVVAARWVLAASDPGTESAGETLARFEVLLAGLPRPVTQLRVEAESHVYWADLGWPEHRVLLEYDGKAKYEANGRASAAVLAEKRRQDRLEAAGWTVVRVASPDLRRPTPWLARLATILGPRP
ncbi:MAG: hypothetical protein GX593_10245 [Actinomycetales bacterium]|nr:hypothetical protein [Actinomycetales bacterium]